MHPTIVQYHDKLEPTNKDVCEVLASEIHRPLPDALS